MLLTFCSVQKTSFKRNTAFLFCGGTAWWKLVKWHLRAFKKDYHDNELWGKQCQVLMQPVKFRENPETVCLKHIHKDELMACEMRKDPKNLQIPLFSNPGENPRIHQEAEQTTRNESFHRLGPSASSAVQDLMSASSKEPPAQGSMEPRPKTTDLHSDWRSSVYFYFPYLGTFTWTQ